MLRFFKHKPTYEEFCQKVNTYLTDPRICKMKEIDHHRGATVYDHVTHVAWLNYRMAMALPISFDMDCLMRISFLHDYFLYDRKDDNKNLHYHGYCHPVVAAENANRDFHITNKEYMGILTHMWPEVFWCFPLSREAWLLCLGDKICAVREYLAKKPQFLSRFKNTKGKDTQEKKKNPEK